MSERNGREAIEDVLDAFVAAESDPSGAVLWKWIRRYPGYRRELTDFAFGWILTENLPPGPDAEEPNEETLARRGRTIIEALLPEEEQERTEEGRRPLVGLLAEGKVLGFSMHELAEATGLSPALVAKLDQRLVRFATVPHEVIGDLARVIKQTADDVSVYLRHEPVLPAGLEYRADEAPSLPEQQDFFDAVRQDRGLDEEKRRRILSLPRPDTG